MGSTIRGEGVCVCGSHSFIHRTQFDVGLLFSVGSKGMR